ncbi:MAG TPA: metallophosphoesterase [Methylosinus sp.]
MYARLFSMTLVAATLVASVSSAGEPAVPASRNPTRTTIAVFGDWPYNANLLNNANRLLNSINKDRDVSLVMHLGDIHSGSSPCTSASILPPIQTSVPGWNQQIYAIFQKFDSPVVYTPGDNEWTDCYKTKAGEAGAPLKELSSLRSLFFARPGWTLGKNDMQVLTQAHNFNPSYPADARYVENMMWVDARTVFVTVNLPGSNNDGLPWGKFENQAAREAEITARTQAGIRWLNAAFDLAAQTAAAVVVGVQADMWDRFAAAPGGDGLDRYTSFVRALATRTLRFGRPVLLLNGDSHIYGWDRPLADPASATGRIHNTPAVPNLTRVTVQGALTKPAEWLKLTIDTRTPRVFSWVNVPFCADPEGSC